jgi:DNA-binding IscR family transcriptional regulator
MIKLSEVYDIVEEGNLYHMHYSSPNEVCPVGAHIQEDLIRILNQAEDSFKMVLETKTIFDMVNGIFEKVASFKEMSKEELAKEWEKTMQNMNN